MLLFIAPIPVYAATVVDVHEGEASYYADTLHGILVTVYLYSESTRLEINILFPE